MQNVFGRDASLASLKLWLGIRAQKDASWRIIEVNCLPELVVKKIWKVIFLLALLIFVG